jgi:hypothetical protein
MIVPRAGMADTKANAMADAMRAYSIAVAPDSSFKKFINLLIQFSKLVLFAAPDLPVTMREARLLCQQPLVSSETLIQPKSYPSH